MLRIHFALLCVITSVFLSACSTPVDSATRSRIKTIAVVSAMPDHVTCYREGTTVFGNRSATMSAEALNLPNNLENGLKKRLGRYRLSMAPKYAASEARQVSADAASRPFAGGRIQGLSEAMGGVAAREKVDAVLLVLPQPFILGNRQEVVPGYVLFQKCLFGPKVTHACTGIELLLFDGNRNAGKGLGAAMISIKEDSDWEAIARESNPETARAFSESINKTMDTAVKSLGF